MIMKTRKRQAQESAGKLRNNHAEKVDEAKQALAPPKISWVTTGRCASICRAAGCMQASA